MKEEEHSVEYGAYIISFRIIRRNRKTLEIAVEPDTSVLVTAPADAALESIDAKVRKRAAWIRRQQRYFTQFLPRTPERRYVAGETHLYLGRQYRLKVHLGDAEGVKLSRGVIRVTTRDPEQGDKVRTLLDRWYRERAHSKFAERLEINLDRFPESSRYRPNGLIIRKIKQRWGSMSASRRLLLNIKLIEAPEGAIDYVITHELCHIAQPNHGPKFFELLSQVMPEWPKHKMHLESLMA